jgi:hypothetical protein
MTLLTDLGIRREHIAYLLNRTTRRAEIRPADVQNLFTGYEFLGEVPADFQTLQPYINTGALLNDVPANLPLMRSLQKITTRIAERMPIARAA